MLPLGFVCNNHTLTRFAVPGTTNTVTNASPTLPVSVSRFAVRRVDYDAGNRVSFSFLIENASSDGAILHIRFPSVNPAITVVPDEAALAPGEKQNALLTVNVRDAAGLAEAGGGTLSQAVLCSFLGTGTAVRVEGILSVSLPVATCPNCKKIVSDDDAKEGVPPVCPFCYERLRACPVCGLPNSWLARQCVSDPAHMVRADPDFPVAPGGGAARNGNRAGIVAAPVLSRRWSFPTVAPFSREAALFFSAPVAAYGLVAVAASDFHGEAHLMAWDTLTGATLWEPFPLESPVYPERGAPAIAGGKLFAATVEGVCVCLDVLRGTRVWETRLPQTAQVYGAVLPVVLQNGDETGTDATVAADLLLVPVTLGAERNRGAIVVLDAETGTVLREIPLGGKTDTAPTWAGKTAFAHDGGYLTAFNPETGTILWQKSCGNKGFDAAPVVESGAVFSASASGQLFKHDTRTGDLLWQLAVTNAPLSGTPACDGTLLYIPADDGLHVVSVSTGRAVRRFGAKRPVRASPVVTAGGTVFWGGTDGAIYGVRGGGVAEPLYDPRTPGAQFALPLALADGALFAVATNGVLFVLEYPATKR